MKIFRDKITGDELFSDLYKMKLEDDVVYKLTGKLTTEGGDVCCNTGANASEEAPDEALDEQTKTGVNIVMAHRLEEINLSKKQFKKCMGTYMKTLKTKLEEEASEDICVFMSNCQKFIAKVLQEFDEYQFFQADACKPEGMVALMRWDAEIAYMYFFKHGVDEERV